MTGVEHDAQRPNPKEQYHGVTKLLNRCVGFLFQNPAGPESNNRSDVVFKGRTRQDAKRALLRYWSENQSHLDMELWQFQRQCAWTSEGEIVFKPVSG